MRNRQQRKIGGKKFAFVARGYTTEINKKARSHAKRGYTYRIFTDGKYHVLYVGPKRKRREVKKRRLKR